MAFRRRSKAVCLLLTIAMLLTLWPGTVLADPDTTPPGFDNDSPREGATPADGSRAVRVVFETQDNEPVYYYLVLLPDGADPPTKEQVRAGLDASGNPALNTKTNQGGPKTSNGSMKISAPQHDTDYDVYMVLRDDAENLSVPAAVYATTPPAANFFVADYPKTGAVQAPASKKIEVLVEVQGTSPGYGKVHYVLVEQGADAPSIDQIIGGKDSTGNNALDKNTISCNNNTETSFLATGDADATAYDLYLVAQDTGVGDLPCTEAVKLEVTTPPATVTSLAAPENLAWDGTTPGKATWDEVANAASYSVQLYKDSAEQGDPVSVLSGTEYDFTSVISETGSYTFKVTAIGDGATYTDSPQSDASPEYDYTAAPPTSPTITGAVMDAQNRYITVTFSEGVYGNAAHTIGIDKDDFTLTFAQNAGGVSGASINWVNKTTGGILPTGGETQFDIWINLVDGPPSGAETITISPKANSIYSSAGVAVPDTESTGVVALHSLPAQSFADGYPKPGTAQATGSHAVQVLAKVNLAGALYYVLLPDNATQPTAQQIKDHANIDGSPVITWAGQVIGADTEAPITLSNGLEHATNYDLYMVAEAGNNNFSAVKKLDVSTPPETDAGSYVCEISGDPVQKFTSLADALAVVADGQTITLLVDEITHNEGIVIDGKTVILNLAGYTLDVVNYSGIGLEVKNNGSLQLFGDSGELNVSGTDDGVKADSGSVRVTTATGDTGARAINGGEITVDGDATGDSIGVSANGSESSITVAGTSKGGPGGSGADAANGATVTVGNATVEAGINNCGVRAASGGTITVEGAITGAAFYLTLDAWEKTADQITTPTTKAGYLTYTNGTSTVWVKDDSVLTYTIAPIANQTMAPLTAGYAPGAQETKTVTVTRTGTGDLANLSVSLSGADAGSFEATQPVAAVLNGAAPSTTFTVKAKDGLAAGTYTATVTITADSMTDVSFTVTQVVGASPIQVAAPTAAPASGAELADGSAVTLATATEGATIHYTTDGSDPNTGSPSGTSVTISGAPGATITVKAFAVKAGMTDSGIAAFTYTIETPPAQVAVTGVSLNKSSTCIITGDSETLSATVAPANATNQAVSWSSSAPGVASVDNAGTVTGMDAGTATITVTTADGNRTASCGVTVSEPVTATPGGTITVTAPVTVTVPAGVTDAKIEVGPGSSLPLVEVNTDTALGTVQVVIPAGTSATGPAGWDGTITLPTVKAQPSATITGAQTVNAVIEVGFGNEPIIFSKAVRLLIPGQAGKSAGYTRNGVFTPITLTLTADDQATADSQIPAEGDAKIDAGSDLAIWTKHFTEFVAYTPSPGNSGGGGGGGGGGGNISTTPPPVNSTTGSAMVKPSAGGKVSLGSEASVTIPAGAIKGSEETKVEVTRIDSPPTSPSGFMVLGTVYEFSVGGSASYSFNKPVTLTFTFDPSELAPGETPAVYYYDDVKGQWLAVGGTVSGGTITVTVDHFTKYAVMVKEKEKEKEPAAGLKDIDTHWAKEGIEGLVARGAISGYPDWTFRPDSAITRAEFATVLVKAFNLEAGSGRVFADTANHWSRDSIAAAAAAGVVSGYEDNTFKPNDPITREQMAVMVAKAAELQEKADITTFTDYDQISPWARDSAAEAVKNGSIKGYPDGSFRPQGLATRAEAATVIVNSI
ncbi:MAG: hypothetical protein HPY50_21395 [Firmicutes bacterium]|nr:hypothetical protein [Bacillota bacterium]